MDELDAFEREVDNAKEALASKLAVISFMECEARINDWSDRELMSRQLWFCHCYRPLGVPGKEEQINVVLFVNDY